jgi:hypothetical protein
MVKKISVVVLAGLLAWPAAAFAASTDQLEQRIEELTRELNQLKAQMQEVKENNEEMSDQFEEKSEKWDQASRFQFSGDFRSRGDYVRTETPAYYGAQDVADAMAAALPTFAANPAYTQAIQDFVAAIDPNLPGQVNPAEFNGLVTAAAPFLNPTLTPKAVYQNDTDLTNRLRLNMRVKVLENVEFKGRLAMYKAWGMQNNPLLQDPFGPYTLNSMSFDGNITRQPGSSALYVDRAFVNWNNIAGLPIWFSIGRRPTTDGPPEQLRLGADERLATPVAYMDYPFDGFSLGYAYRSLFGLGDAPGRIRFCMGRGFQTVGDINGNGINDVDFAGFSWDMYKKGNRFLYLQTFGAFNMFNVPDNVIFPNPLEIALAGPDASLINNVNNLADIQAGDANGILNRANLGNIYHTSAIYMDKWQNLNYFVAGGWSHTDPHGYDELGNSLLTSWWGPLDSKDGYSVYVGGRYDLDDYGLKFGLEYNHGSKDWISFTPGNDDLYQSKLAARGDVYEAYLIWSIPGGEAISKYAKAFMRFGYQYYKYDYTGSGYWLGAPVNVDDLTASALNAQFYAPTDHQNQVYVTFEAWF